MKIVTEYVHPPIPVRTSDWSATSDDYEPGDPIGYGSTEADAIADLQAAINDAYWADVDRAELELGFEDDARELCAAVAKECWK